MSTDSQQNLDKIENTVELEVVWLNIQTSSVSAASQDSSGSVRQSMTANPSTSCETSHNPTLIWTRPTTGLRQGRHLVSDYHKWLVMV